MGHNFTLGILDQCPVRYDGTATQALRETIELARFCEELGYQRYWVTEHHNAYAFASTSPEILVSQIAANTSSIRVGSGGVMLLNYSALKVAEQFRILEAFYPNRIDLGVGKARGTDELGSRALSYPRLPIDSQEFEEQVRDLLSYIKGCVTPDHQFSGLILQPGLATEALPEVWILGTSINSAKFAGEMGLKYSFGHFLVTNNNQPIIATKIYQDNFKPSSYTQKPEVSVAIEVFCAKTEEEISYITASRNLEKAVSHLDLKSFSGFLPPDQALIHLQDKTISKAFDKYSHLFVDGTQKQIKGKIASIAEYYNADQVLILTNCYSFEVRKQSYKLIAEAFFD